MTLPFKTDCLKQFGMSDLTTFRSVIELWPSRDAMASDIGAGASAVSKWWQRDNIPVEWWSPILATERAVHAGISALMMTTWAARPAIEPRAEPTEARA